MTLLIAYYIVGTLIASSFIFFHIRYTYFVERFHVGETIRIKSMMERLETGTIITILTLDPFRLL